MGGVEGEKHQKSGEFASRDIAWRYEIATGERIVARQTRIIAENEIVGL